MNENESQTEKQMCGERKGKKNIKMAMAQKLNTQTDFTIMCFQFNYCNLL